MTGSHDELESEIDRLYGLPLEEFTPARDELAKRARGQGDRDRAAKIKRLRKPTLPAWALNQVQRREPGRVAGLIDAGGRLQDAQERLVAGGERGLLRDASADERRSVEQVVALGEQELAGASHPVGTGVQSKLWATARAAAVNPEARGLLRAGRLTRDYEVSDLGLVGAGAAATEAPRTEPSRTRSARTAPTATTDRATDRAAAAERKEAERKARGLRRQLHRARAQHDAAQERLDDARTRVRDARREAERAASKLERAEAAAGQAGERADIARARVDELEVALRELI
jgi:hypothetical protein